MKLKKSFIAVITALFAILTFTTTTNAEAMNSELIKIDFSTDKEAYEKDDVVESTLTISNQSTRYSAKNINVQTELPEDFEVSDNDENFEFKDGIIHWNIENLKREKDVTLSFQTQLTKESTSDEQSEENSDNNNKKDEDDNEDETPRNNNEDDNENETTKNNNKDGNQTEDDASLSAGKSDDDFASPQTGDNKSFLIYMIIFIVSLITSIIAIILIKKKRLSKAIVSLIALGLVLPTVATTHAETNENTITLEKNHEIVMDGKTYDIKTNITLETKDHYDEILTTGTAIDSQGNILTNTSLTFTATAYDTTIEEVVETDEEGYFVSRLAKDATYTIKGNQLSAEIKATDVNEITVSNETGTIELGKQLNNDDNHTKFQPSVLYLSEDETNKINDISSNLDKVTADASLDIRAGDYIVISQFAGFDNGVTLFVTSVEKNGDQLILQTEDPEIEDIFAEIVGDISTDITPEYFNPEEGVTISDDQADLFSTYGVSTFRSIPLNNKLKISIDDLYKSDEFSINGDVEISGSVDGNIDWRLGLNPVESMDLHYEGEQSISADMEIGIKGELTQKDDMLEFKLGEFRVPTKVPGLIVNLPVKIIGSVEGKVSYTLTAGATQSVGLAYQRGEGMRTYPEKKFSPYFHASDIVGTGKASLGVKATVGALAINKTIVDVGFESKFEGEATTSILGGNGAFSCAGIEVEFANQLVSTAPLFKWEADLELGNPIPIFEKTFGNCVKKLKVSPNEIELEPEETKSVTIKAHDDSKEVDVNNDDNIKFNISEPNKLQVSASENRVDVKATEDAVDGDIIQVEVVYEQLNKSITDTLEVKIVDSRPQGELVGNVSDAVTKESLNKANVKIYKDNKVINQVKTNENGDYTVPLAPGKYKVEVEHNGYIKDTSRVTIESTDTTTYDAKLELVGNDYNGEGIVTGKIKDAVTGAGIADVNIDIRKGKNNVDGEVVKSLTTDANGYYEVELNGGNYTINLAKDGYISTHTNIISIGGETKSNQDGTLSSSEVIDDNLRIVLTWGKDPRDLDSHLTGPKADSEERFHVWYRNKQYKDTANDINLDRDDVNSYGPETVTVINRLQKGTYTYAVHNYTGRNLNEDNKFDLSKSDAKVEVYRDNTLLHTYNVPLNKAGNAWNVLEIRDGEIVPINTITTVDGWSSPDYFPPVN